MLSFSCAEASQRSDWKKDAKRLSAKGTLCCKKPNDSKRTWTSSPTRSTSSHRYEAAVRVMEFKHDADADPCRPLYNSNPCSINSCPRRNRLSSSCLRSRPETRPWKKLRPPQRLLQLLSRHLQHPTEAQLYDHKHLYVICYSKIFIPHTLHQDMFERGVDKTKEGIGDIQNKTATIKCEGIR